MSATVIPDWYSQNIYLILGMLLIFGALASTYTGKTRSRFSGWVYRAEEPGVFGGQSQYITSQVFSSLYASG